MVFDMKTKPQFIKMKWKQVLRGLESKELRFFSGVGFKSNFPTIIFATDIRIGESFATKEVGFALQVNKHQFKKLKKKYPNEMKEIEETWVQKNMIGEKPPLKDAKTAVESDVSIKKTL